MLAMTPADQNILGITLAPNAKAVGLGKYLVQFPGCVLTTVDFQSPGKEGPFAAQRAVGKSDPIFVGGDKGDVGLVDFPPPHLEFAVIHFDPPFPTVGATELPLILEVNSLRLIRLKTPPHPIEHVLWRRVRRLIRRSHDRTQANCRSSSRNSQERLRIHAFNLAKVSFVPIISIGCFLNPGIIDVGYNVVARALELGTK